MKKLPLLFFAVGCLAVPTRMFPAKPTLPLIDRLRTATSLEVWIRVPIDVRRTNFDLPDRPVEAEYRVQSKSLLGEARGVTAWFATPSPLKWQGNTFSFSRLGTGEGDDHFLALKVEGALDPSGEKLVSITVTTKSSSGGALKTARLTLKDLIHLTPVTKPGYVTGPIDGAEWVTGSPGVMFGVAEDRYSKCASLDYYRSKEHFLEDEMVRMNWGYKDKNQEPDAGVVFRFPKIESPVVVEDVPDPIPSVPSAPPQVAPKPPPSEPVSTAPNVEPKPPPPAPPLSKSVTTPPEIAPKPPAPPPTQPLKREEAKVRSPEDVLLAFFRQTARCDLNGFKDLLGKKVRDKQCRDLATKRDKLLVNPGASREKMEAFIKGITVDQSNMHIDRIFDSSNKVRVQVRGRMVIRFPDGDTRTFTYDGTDQYTLMFEDSAWRISPE